MEATGPTWRQPTTHARHNVVGQESSLDSALHLARYVWARDHYCRPGMAVLDLGCGSGFGVAMLAEVAMRVVGVDFSDEGLAQAQTLHPAANACYLRADLTDPSLVPLLGGGPFDLVTSMETIEHLDDYITFVASTSRLVAADGVFVVGTPNRRMTYERYPERRHMDPSHVQEFTMVALEHLLGEFFEQVEMHLQCIRDYWGTEGANPVAGSDGWGRLREWLPPRLVPIVRRSLTRTRWSGAAAPRTWSIDDVVFVESAIDPELESEAFCLVAVCQGPKHLDGDN